MQTTLLGFAIAVIIALLAAIVGPYFIDWNQFRPQFEAEASRVMGAPVRVDGSLDARLLPVPKLRLQSVIVGGANDLGKVRADKLDVEFSLGSLLRGEWRANELTINGLALDLGLDAQGRVDWPASTGKFNLGSLAIDRLNFTGRIALHDAISRSTLELNDIAFSGDVRSLAGSLRGDGNFVLSDTRFPFRISSGQTADGNGTRLHLNVDPGARALSLDLDGVLMFDARAPRFNGAITMASQPKGAEASKEAPRGPWRMTAKIKADPAAAHLEQLEVNYGSDETALKFAGLADVRFGASPLLHATLSARQIDLDRLLAKDNTSTEPPRWWPALRNMFALIPQAPLATQIEISAEQIMLGGRTVQNVGAELRGDPKSWTVDKLDFRAPGVTRVTLNGAAQSASPGTFSGVLNVDSPDPDTLAAWLQGRSEVTYRNQKPLRLRGNLNSAPDRFAIDILNAEIDGGVVEGRVAIGNNGAAGGSRLDASLKAENLDLDAAVASARSLVGPQAEWPDEAQISLDVGRAVTAGQELKPLAVKFAYGPKNFSLDRLRIGDSGSVMVEGSGSLDRVDSTGKLSLSATSASFARIAGLLSPYSPAIASRLGELSDSSGSAGVKLALGLEKNSEHADRANARAVIEIDTPQIKGVTTITSTPNISAIRTIDLDALARSEIVIDSKLSSAQGHRLLALVGLDRAIAAGDGLTQFEGSATGVWRAPLRAKLKLTGAQLDGEGQGSVDPWTSEPKANFDLRIRRVDLGPLLGLKASDISARNVSLSSRVSLDGKKVVMQDMDSVVAGSRLRGHVAVTLGEEKAVEGELGLDTLDLGPVFGLAIGYTPGDATQPFSRGLMQGWRGHLAFQALHGTLPGGGELRPVSGSIKGDGQSLTFDTIKGKIGGGEATADIDAKQTANGIALNARLQLSGVDGAALHYGTLAMPAGRASMRMTLSGLGRSASALTGSLSGDGLVTLDSAKIGGLNPQVFETAIRSSDEGQATDDVKLRQIIEPVLSAGGLSVAAVQIPFDIKDGRLRVGSTTIESDGARATIAGGYDIAADQVDIRATLTSTSTGSVNSRPGIEIFTVGTPSGLNRTVDVAALSSWLAVRAIDRETRRLDSIERGELPPTQLPASIPAPATTTPTAHSPSPAAAIGAPELPLSGIPIPGRAPPRSPLKPKAFVPRAPSLPPVASAPVIPQQVAPLPPPIEVRPLPIARPKPRPPLILTPPALGTQ